MTGSPGRFVWTDLVTHDQKKAIDFYTKLLELGSQTTEFETFTHTALKKDESWVGGGIVTANGIPAEVPSHWLPYLTVNDVDKATETALGLGATQLSAPEDIPEVGRFSIIQDPQGAVVALYKAFGEMGEIEFSGTPFRFCWGELSTDDVKASKEFYSKVTGWSEYKEWDMGDGSFYHMPQADNMDAAGIYKKSPEDPSPPHWTVYFAVPDVDARAETTQKLGGKVLMGPQDIPGVGRFAIIMDTVGAVIGLMTGEPK